MRLVVLFLVAVPLCVAQYAVCSTWTLRPDLGLGLLAWVLVDGDEDGLAWRALVIGAVQDGCDPVPGAFHTCAALLLVAGFLPLRHLVFRSRATGWFAVAAIMAMLVSGVDVLSGRLAGPWWSLPLEAVASGICAAFFGWLHAGLPADWRLLPPAGA